MNEIGLEEIKGLTFDSFMGNMSYYVEKFLSDGVLFLKNFNPTRQQEWDIMVEFGNRINWFPNSTTGIVPTGPYECKELEDHRYTFEAHTDTVNDKDHYFIHWHLDGVDRDKPQMGSLWHMRQFDCAPDSGQTGFVNMGYFYENLSEDYKNFLLSCGVKRHYRLDVTGFDYNLTDQQIKDSSPMALIVDHHFTDKKILRMDFYINESSLHSFNGRPATEEEKLKYTYIHADIINQFCNDSSISKWIEWEKGDVIIIDLFVMAHAVKGGFKLGERKFSRIWAYKEEYIPFNR